ncbi:MAG: alpha/beta hydrolase [Deltaproteobacteria bacterium]|nr:alpha/beta hydrolase [Candidatus Desulfobacula maris]MBL6992574.1 alpha/beta hydrolase [Desulfobacula sp.]
MIKETENNAPFHLVGHFYGGAIALKLAVKLLARIRTLTLFEPVAFHLLPSDGAAHNEITTIVKNLTQALEKKDKTLATKLFIDYWSGKGTFENLKQKNQAVFIQYIDKVVLDFQALFNESLTLKDYSKVNIPVSMIKGEKSPLTSIQIFQILEHYLPDRSIHSVPGGHMSPITHVNKVNKIIENFLTAHALG